MTYLNLKLGVQALVQAKVLEVLTLAELRVQSRCSLLGEPAPHFLLDD